MIQLVIIADDFTGALDTGVQFATAGVATRVITSQNVSFEAYAQTCTVLVVDAETRHLTAAEAYSIVFEIVSKAEEARIPHIYKKTDSALRGNVGAELTALLRASCERALPFLPAFPQMERNTINGSLYIQGVPVADSVFGRDPFEPVTCSDVRSLIALQSDLPTVGCPVCASAKDRDGILVFDTSSVDDLQIIGNQLKQDGNLHILAGCAGFASVLPDLLELEGDKHQPIPALGEYFTVICGSVNPITVAQVSYAQAKGFAHCQLEPEQKLSSGYWQTARGEEMLQALYRMLETNPHRILDTNDPGSNRKTADYAARFGMDMQDIRRAVSDTIGYLVSRLFSHEALGTLLITGGDTLLQCMEYMGVHEIEPLGEMDAGVVLSRFSYQGVTRYIISKSGGFGGESLLVDLAAALKN